MKKVLVDSELRVSGSLSPEETIIDPETDLISDESDPVEFSIYETVEVVLANEAFHGTGVVTEIHDDEFGVLIQIDVDWEGLEPIVS